MRHVPHAWLFCLIGATITLTSGVTARAQLSSESWWPKYQRDAQNTGRAPTVSISTDAHVSGYLRLSAPITAENHATPVFAPGNSRLYVGGTASRLTAIDLDSFTEAWRLTLGDGTGTIYHTPAIGADGSIFVGAWDNQPPFDGFSKVRDDGDQATIVWTAPLRRMLASPTIADNGLIIIGGRHDALGWGYFAFRDLGDSYELAWSAALRADSSDPGSTGNVGASPALSTDSQFMFGGSDQNRSFWKINLSDGAETARVPLTQYCWASAPLVTPDGYVLISEGMSFTAPNADTEGKLYVMRGDAAGTEGIFESLPLRSGHLNGGAAALSSRGSGVTHRVYVTANGYGASAAELIALDFDSQAPSGDPPAPALTEAWRVSIGGPALCYPNCVTTRDSGVFVISPADHVLRGYRDTGASAASLWSLSLALISRVEGWVVANQRGPQAPLVGPRGDLYWNAPDGYVYQISGWLTGDMNGDEVVDSADVELLEALLADRGSVELRFPEVPIDAVADVNASGVIDAADVIALRAIANP